MSNEPKVRYSDEELQEFKALIDDKIAKSAEELQFTQQQIAELNENGFNQQGGDWYDDTSSHTDLEMLQRMMVRQQKHIQDLKNALLRIQNKTYGICTITGQLIDKQRLRAVPHATKSVDGKNIANSGKDLPNESGGGSADPLGLGAEDNGKGSGKPIADKVRIPNVKKTSANGDDWEPDNESLEDAGYRRRRDEDDE